MNIDNKLSSSFYLSFLFTFLHLSKKQFQEELKYTNLHPTTLLILSMDMGRCPHLLSGYIKGDHAQLDYRTDLRHGGVVRLTAVNNIYEWFTSNTLLFIVWSSVAMVALRWGALYSSKWFLTVPPCLRISPQLKGHAKGSLLHIEKCAMTWSLQCKECHEFHSQRKVV